MKIITGSVNDVRELLIPISLLLKNRTNPGAISFKSEKNWDFPIPGSEYNKVDDISFLIYISSIYLFNSVFSRSLSKNSIIILLFR